MPTTKGFMGFDKEPPQPNGPSVPVGGKRGPQIHSHSKSPIRKIAPPRKATSKSSI